MLEASGCELKGARVVDSNPVYEHESSSTLGRAAGWRCTVAPTLQLARLDTLLALQDACIE